MPRPVAVGIDGSAASLAAAAWAAREAELRGTSLHLVAAWPPPNGRAPEPPEAIARRHWAARSLDLARDRLRGRHPRLDIRARLLGLAPREALLTAGLTADLLVLGSCGLGGTSAHHLGSTGAETAAQADFPLALVRTTPHPAHPPAGPVLLALDTQRVRDDVIAVAFEEAALREVPLRALYAWMPARPVRTYPVMPGPYGHSPHARRAEQWLTEALLPWRQKFPDIRVEEVCLEDVPAGAVTAAAHHAVLAVLGHRIRTAADGARLGAVARAAVHQAACPVLLVPHT
ncbi:universal stress protein [Streptomyces sp. Act143]|uniref:universal stress protein n=1 Tax=Streptomyces sp. Act143 TaxID=2200760 RepID=UPI0011B4CAF9|nr:universal stress protein [Streptomyces sp. Act143]